MRGERWRRKRAEKNLCCPKGDYEKWDFTFPSTAFRLGMRLRHRGLEGWYWLRKGDIFVCIFLSIFSPHPRFKKFHRRKKTYFVFNSFLLAGKKIDFSSSNICLRVINFHSSVFTRFLLSIKMSFRWNNIFLYHHLRKWI